MEFSYNYLNLLEKAGETNYTYSADGAKLSVKNGANGFDYLGSLILSNSSTEFQFSDGVINKTTGGYAVNYFLRDHLGSVRTVVDKDKNILQQSDYYPFGLKQERADYVNNSNRFLYNGKELQTTGDLGVLDYGARMYDPTIGRWSVNDALAEKYYDFSPYNYCVNNPINIIDPDGNDWVKHTESDTYQWQDNVTSRDQVSDGYTYVGASDNDILVDMNVQSKYPIVSDGTVASIPAGGDGVGPFGAGIPSVTAMTAKAGLTISANVSIDESKSSSNNKSGKTFEGITVTGIVSLKSISGDSESRMTGGGTLNVNYGGKNIQKVLQTPRGSGLREAGSVIGEARVRISAKDIKSSKSLSEAVIRIGSTNQGGGSRPMSLGWSLSVKPVFRSK